MFKKTLIATALLVSSFVTFAQTPAAPAPGAGPDKARAEEMRKHREEAKAKREEKKAKHEEMKAKHEEMKAKHEEMKAKHEEKKANKPVGAP